MFRLPRVPVGVIALLVVAALTSALVWILHAPRFFVFTEASYSGFWNRRILMLFHVCGGTIALFVGPFLVWSGLHRWKPRVHRWFGRLYLVGGALGVGAGAILSVLATLPPKGLYVATFTLALAWFAASAMAYRAIRNRRIPEHQQWVTRSYVLTLTFVACRLVMRLPVVTSMGDEAIVAAVWVSWVVPLLIAEVALQWGKTAAISRESPP